MSCENCEESAYVIDKLAKLLAEIAVIVNGPEPPLTSWSYHDLPEKVRALKEAPPAAVPAEDDSAEVLRELSATLIDRSPERHKAIERTLHSLAFYRKRCELMQRVQAHMRDPERVLVCDILANGQLLGPLDGPRYAPPAAAVPEGYALVPVEPTQGMLDAAGMSIVPAGKEWLDQSNRETWAAMLAAAERKGEP